MKRNPLLILCLALALPAGGPSAQSVSLIQLKLQLTVEGIARFHFRPPPGDVETFSADLVDHFTRRLDPEGMILTGADIAQLKRLGLDLRRPGQPANAQFLNRALVLYGQRLGEAKQSIAAAKIAVAAAPPDGAIDWIDDNELQRAGDAAELQKRWEKLLQYRRLQRVYHLQLPPTFTEYEAALRSDGAEALVAAARREQAALRAIESYPGGVAGYLNQALLNALTAAIDPHSQYLSDSDRRDFETALSSRGLSFGIVLEKTLFGASRINRIIPGSVAWRSGLLNRGDVLLELRYPDENNRRIQAIDLNPFELENELARANLRKVVLRVRKNDGRIVEATLYKTQLRLEENTVSGFVLRGQQRIGYIYLPSFYLDWEDSGRPGAAGDVARQILKLKSEGIDALILDLRNNGGGSLSEAQDLAGMFIDQGPLFVAVDRSGQYELLKDRNRGAIYTGPLAIMVNGGSASASEFLAGVLQDYNRAIVVGGRTFGKASSQIVMTMPRSGPVADHLKLTTHLFYNTRGVSHQATGIEPDIELPDAAQLYSREQDAAAVLRAAPLGREFVAPRLAELPIAKLRDESEDRTADNESFERITDLAEDIDDRLAALQRPSLRPDRFFAALHGLRLAIEAYQQAERRASAQFRVEGHAFDGELERVDDYRREFNEERRQRIAEDIYIDETYSILSSAIPVFAARGRR